MKNFKSFLTERAPTPKNKGVAYEQKFNRHLYKHGLMSTPKTQGSKAGNDFHLVNKKQMVIHRGKVYDGKFQGETKANASSASFGQLAIRWDKEAKRWGLHPDNVAKRPEFAHHIENAKVTVEGKTKYLLDHVNEVVPKPEKGHIHVVRSDETSVRPAHAYGRDHKADVIHVGGKGTYAFGNGEHKDKTGIGLPRFAGRGFFEVRRKYPNNPFSLHVAFKVKGGSVPKSKVDLENESHLPKIKKALGHS